MQDLPRPTADELQQLSETFRADPGRTFVPLARALLALGRPRDAVQVAAQGIKVAPGSIEGRFLLGQAFYQLHQWKEAQAQLVRVVKEDRTHAAGFPMLGEVLMRRGDYERALPVLQHAANLNPANAGILTMIKRARSGQALDPPAPIPTPMEPAGAGGPGLPGADSDFEEEPTNLAPRRLLREDLGLGPAGPGAGPDLAPGVDQPPFGQPPGPPGGLAHGAASAPPAGGPAGPQPGGPTGPGPGGPGGGAAPPIAPPQRAKRPSVSPEGVRPRVFAPDKRKDAAKESLRASAEVGEHYLNNLLVGGLLDLPNVRVSEPDYKLDTAQKWGRSAGRTFLVLFVLLFLGVASGGAWYYYAEKQKEETIAQYMARARSQAESGSHGDLERALADAKAALELDKRDPYSVAMLSQIMGVSSYLYREIPPAEVNLGIETAERSIQKPGQRGYRELLIARSAATLALLSELDSSDERLAEIRKQLRAHLADKPDDHMARWLSGRAMLAAGDRKGAAAAFEQAAARGEGSILATIDRANMLLDDGEHEKALAIYDEVLKKSPDHPLACVGRSLARSERSTESAEAMADLNVCLGKELGPRIAAYRQLALAYVHYFLEDYGDFADNLDKATGVYEPRFLARKAHLDVLRGEIADAGKLRASVKWYAPDPAPHPLVTLVDAELFYATGALDEVMDTVGKAKGLRAAKLRAKVYWEQAKYEEAADEFEAALKLAPEDLESQIYMAAVKVSTSRGTERKAAEADLDRLGRRAKTKLPRHIYGEVLLRDGKFDQAREEFETALTDISAEAPHRMAYKSHVALAELDEREARLLEARAGDDADGAKEAAAKIAELRTSALKHLNAALKQNPSNLPALDLAGRLLADRDPEKALEFLISVVDSGTASGRAELTYARLLASSKNDTDVEKAKEAVLRAANKGGNSDEDLAAVATQLGGEDFAKKVLSQ